MQVEDDSGKPFPLAAEVSASVQQQPAERTPPASDRQVHMLLLKDIGVRILSWLGCFANYPRYVLRDQTYNQHLQCKKQRKSSTPDPQDSKVTDSANHLAGRGAHKRHCESAYSGVPSATRGADVGVCCTL